MRAPGLLHLTSVKRLTLKTRAEFVRTAPAALMMYWALSTLLCCWGEGETFVRASSLAVVSALGGLAVGGVFYVLTRRADWPPIGTVATLPYGGPAERDGILARLAIIACAVLVRAIIGLAIRLIGWGRTYKSGTAKLPSGSDTVDGRAEGVWDRELDVSV
jgi:hypothetical protein